MISLKEKMAIKNYKKVYNVDFKKKIDMDIGLKYQAYEDKKIDVW